MVECMVGMYDCPLACTRSWLSPQHHKKIFFKKVPFVPSNQTKTPSTFLQMKQNFVLSFPHFFFLILDYSVQSEVAFHIV